jgi:antitoxin (DNA-binding transcriptional repressor) of toxin-antitoxin stability system
MSSRYSIYVMFFCWLANLASKAINGVSEKPFLVDCSGFSYAVREALTMRQISLREFRTRGSKALEAVPQGETILLSGQQGPAYFLVPVLGDVAMEDRELRRAMAKVSLRESWLHAKVSGMDQMNDEEIEQEIKRVRRAHKRRTTS